jgi:hypothetical protein
MQFSDDCRSHALVLIEIANESPKFKEQALALAESWLTLANIVLSENPIRLGGVASSGRIIA